MNLNIFQNLDLFSVGVVVAATVVLGFSVYFSNPKSITNKTFLWFALVTAIWGVVNYSAYQTNNPVYVLWLLRLIMFFAVWQAFAFFQFCFVFPQTERKFSKTYIITLIPLVIATSLIALTPLLFSKIVHLSEAGTVSDPDRGPGLFLFAPVAVGLVLAGLAILFKKVLFIREPEFKRNVKLVLAGSLIMFTLIIVFNFVIPILMHNRNFIPLGALFVFPFIAFTSYAVIKHRLFNIKVLATEILTVVLAIVTFLETIFSNSVGILIFRSSIFLLVLSFGVLLIRSVRKEVEQREQLQVLTNKLSLANVELKKLDKAKSEFVSIASHQLRTPLTASKGYLSLVLGGTYGKLEEKLLKPLHNVYESNERLIRLVNDLLSLSRIESGKIKLEPEQLNLQELIQSVIEELDIKAKQKNLQLLFKESSQPLPSVFADREKIRNVILNLIDNAIRYTEKGSITTAVEQVKNNVHLSVTDTGAGMTKVELDKLFESFSRGQAGMKLSTEGAGLGLYIARQFVKMHKGRIWAESPGKGQGSTFHVELPIKT